MAVLQRYPVTGFSQRGMMVKVIALPLTCADAPIIVVWVRARLKTAASVCVCCSSGIETLRYGRRESFCVFVSMPSSGQYAVVCAPNCSNGAGLRVHTGASI